MYAFVGCVRLGGDYHRVVSGSGKLRYRPFEGVVAIGETVFFGVGLGRRLGYRYAFTRRLLAIPRIVHCQSAIKRAAVPIDARNSLLFAPQTPWFCCNFAIMCVRAPSLGVGIVEVARGGIELRPAHQPLISISIAFILQSGGLLEGLQIFLLCLLFTFRGARGRISCL